MATITSGDIRMIRRKKPKTQVIKIRIEAEEERKGLKAPTVVGKKVIARPTRQNFSFGPWPDEHLATVRALYRLRNSLSTEGKFKLLNKYRPDIGEAYFERNGRSMTAKHVYNRNDKAWRENEEKNYEHLLPAAEEAVRSWGKKKPDHDEDLIGV
jgi:hypothetical protein